MPSFALSSDLKRINRNIYDDDFEIRFKNTSLKVPTFIAEFLSPVVSSLLSNDQTTRSIYIDINVDESTIESLDALTRGQHIDAKYESEVEFCATHFEEIKKKRQRHHNPRLVIHLNE